MQNNKNAIFAYNLLKYFIMKLTKNVRLVVLLAALLAMISCGTSRMGCPGKISKAPAKTQANG
jgi:hypothetical protein